MPKLEVGDVVRWEDDSNRESLGGGPFLIIGKYKELFVMDNLDGSPLKKIDMRDYPDGRQHYYQHAPSLRRDEFLTAVRRAKMSQEKCADSG